MVEMSICWSMGRGAALGPSAMGTSCSSDCREKPSMSCVDDMTSSSCWGSRGGGPLPALLASSDCVLAGDAAAAAAAAAALAAAAAASCAASCDARLCAMTDAICASMEGGSFMRHVLHPLGPAALSASRYDCTWRTTDGCCSSSFTVGRSTGTGCRQAQMNSFAAGLMMWSGRSSCTCSAGLELMIFSRISWVLLPLMAAPPVSMAYMSTPHAHTSAAAEYSGPPRVCLCSAGLALTGHCTTSGAMKARVPSRVLARSVVRSTANPKSASLMALLLSNRMLPGLMSRCTMPMECRRLMPCSTCRSSDLMTSVSRLSSSILSFTRPSTNSSRHAGNSPSRPSSASPSVASLSNFHTSHWLPFVNAPSDSSEMK
mmetsp:Transcript_13641/g.33546  ORF Transcript_13641/g.33546 Transcript_13641/m.33546 type:complete len:373 (-) Transcript_13641:699-1817(-)